MADKYQFKLESYYGATLIKGIKFSHGTNVSDTLSTNAITFSMPGQSSEDNLASNLGGFTQLVNFNFILEDNGTDVSTTSDSIVTLQQQWEYITGKNGVIQDAGVNSSVELLYKITIYFFNSTGVGVTKSYVGMISDVAIEPVEGEPLLRGRLSLVVGGNNPVS